MSPACFVMVLFLMGLVNVSIAQECTSDKGSNSCASTSDPAEKYKSKWESSTVEDIKNVEEKIYRPEDVREDHQLLSLSHMNIFTLLQTTPKTIAVLGHLVLVTMHKDIPLQRSTVGFKHIKYPESLRASTVQLVNKAWSAFSLAEKSMDQIRIYTSQIPKYVDTVEKILLAATKQEIKIVLPGHLRVIDKITKKCVEQANLVENTFRSVQDLAEELEETVIVTQEFKEKKYQDSLSKKKRVERQIDAAEKAEERMLMESQRIQLRVQEAYTDFINEKESMPGAIKLTLMSLVDRLTKIFSSSGKHGPYEEYVKQAYFRVENAKLALERAKDEYKKMIEKIEKERHNSQTLLDELSEVKLDQVDLNEVKELTQTCLRELAVMHQEWSNLVRFFQKLSNLIQSAMGDKFELFIETMKVEPDPSLKLRFSNVMLEVIHNEAVNAINSAFTTSELARIYLEISSQHLIGPLSQFGKLSALDPVKDKHLIEEKQKKLSDVCKKAIEEITRYVQNRREEFLRRTNNRIDAINSEMKDVLPHHEPEDNPNRSEHKEDDMDVTNRRKDDL